MKKYVFFVYFWLVIQFCSYSRQTTCPLPPFLGLQHRIPEVQLRISRIPSFLSFFSFYFFLDNKPYSAVHPTVVRLGQGAGVGVLPGLGISFWPWLFPLWGGGEAMQTSRANHVVPSPPSFKASRGLYGKWVVGLSSPHINIYKKCIGVQVQTHLCR